jgi:hypothetical protein
MKATEHCGDSIRQTRYDQLGYVKHAANLWRFVVEDEDGRTAVTGPQYKSKGELLADLERFAANYGLA